MRNSKEIVKDLQRQIHLPEPPSEIETITHLIAEKILNLSYAEIAAEKLVEISPAQEANLQKVVERINRHEPLQYVLEEAYFFGRSFFVNSSVLIPRPETELLVEEVIRSVNLTEAGTIIDIGTGSGCIAITLAKELPSKKIVAVDVSADALAVAWRNANQLKARIDFAQLDILNNELQGSVELIVSNPPYIAAVEAESMKANVVAYEPHLALFVPNDDPLVFYKAIAQQGKRVLTPQGKVFVEINERFGKEVAEVFRAHGYTEIRIIKDYQEKDRIVIATNA